VTGDGGKHLEAISVKDAGEYGMKSQDVWMLLVSLLLVGCGQEPEPSKVVQEQPEHEQTPEEQAVAAIREIGGLVVSHKVPGNEPAGKEGLMVRLTDTQVTDAGLTRLKKLTDLRVLFLEGPQVTDASLEHLTELTNLNRLSLHNTLVTGEGIGKFRQALPELTISSDWTHSVPMPEVSPQEKAKLKQPYPDQEEAIGELIRLGGGFSEDGEALSFGLFGSRVDDAGMEHLKGLTNLRSLYLCTNQVTDAGMEHLKGLRNLRTLDLGVWQVTDAGLECLQGLRNIETLGLAGTQVTDTGLEHLKGMTELKFLDLRTTRVTDAGLEHLKELPHLYALQLSDTRVTIEGVERLKQALPCCKVSQVNGFVLMKLLGRGPSEREPIVRAIAAIERLGGKTSNFPVGSLWVILTDTEVMDADLERLKGLAELAHLHLENTKVTDAGLQHLKGLTNLQELNLVDTHVTDEGVKNLQQALPACKISH